MGVHRQQRLGVVGHPVEAIPAGDDDDLRSRAVIRPLLRTALALAVAIAVAGCDTGDGTTLTPPAPGQTAPPLPTSTDDVESVGTLASVPITTLPATTPAAGEAGVTVAVPEGAAAAGLGVFAPWVDGAPIDARYTCAGQDVAPPVGWAGLPAGTTGVAVSFVDETTAGDGERGFVHWVIAGLDPAQVTLVEGRVPDGAVQALNFFGDVGYGGPCPPPGELHEYRLTVHALDTPVQLPDGTPALDLLAAVEAASIESRGVVGTFRGVAGDDGAGSPDGT
jgi:hypothetical protein